MWALALVTGRAEQWSSKCKARNVRTPEQTGGRKTTNQLSVPALTLWCWNMSKHTHTHASTEMPVYWIRLLYLGLSQMEHNNAYSNGAKINGALHIVMVTWVVFVLLFHQMWRMLVRKSMCAHLPVMSGVPLNDW